MHVSLSMHDLLSFTYLSWLVADIQFLVYIYVSLAEAVYLHLSDHFQLVIVLPSCMVIANKHLIFSLVLLTFKQYTPQFILSVGLTELLQTYQDLSHLFPTGGVSFENISYCICNTLIASSCKD